MNKINQGEKQLIISAIIFGFFGIIARYLSNNIDISLTVIIVNLIQFLYFGFICIKNKDFKILRNNLFSLIIFVIINSFPLILFNNAITHLSIGGVLLLQNTTTIIVSICVDLFILKKKLNFYQFGLIIVALLGLIVIYLPFELVSVLGILFAIGVGLTNAVSNYLRGKLSNKNSSSKLILYSSITSIIIWGGYLLLSEPTQKHIYNLNILVLTCLCIYGVLNIITSFLLISGFSKVNLTIGNLILMLEIIFGFLFGYIVIGESFGSYQLAGNLIVLISIVLIRVIDNFILNNIGFKTFTKKSRNRFIS